jgi:OOP family OmpA-OmpF porin
MSRPTLALFSALALGAVGCASPQLAPTVDAPVLVPGAQERVAIDQLVVLVDSSSSVSEDGLFEDEKSLARSFASSVPDGDYETSLIAFGGFSRQRVDAARFERGSLVQAAESVPYLAEGTPIHKAIREAGAELEGKSGRAAIVLYSDGVLTTEGGKDLDPQLALDAANEVAEGYDGEVCFHTVQVGAEAEGTALLRAIAGATPCGSYRERNGITTVATLHQFERDVFLAEVPTPRVAAAPVDPDGDGVIGAADLCPNTPRVFAPEVDAEGCVVVRALFDTDSSELRAAATQDLDKVAEVLRENPDTRVSLDGYTDSTGPDAYNRTLSERRAGAVRDYLVKSGIEGQRLQTKGLGETNPIGDNETPEGRQKNRRTEISAIQN